MTFYLGLTGGIATGKSTADRFFIQKGIPVIDADQISHEVLKVGHSGWHEIKRVFGEAYFKTDQTVDRHKLGQLVFSNESALKKLNAVIHPIVSSKLKQQMLAIKSGLCVVDVPLLFESQMQSHYDATLLITLPQERQLKRLMARNQLTRKEALNRIKSQMPLDLKKTLATYAIANTGTIEELEAKLAELLTKLQ